MLFKLVPDGQIPAQVRISRAVFLCADQAGHTLDVHKAAVIPDQVLPCFQAAQVVPEDLLVDLEAALHPGNEGDSRIKEDICVRPGIIACIKYRKLRIYAIVFQVGDRTRQCADVDDVSRDIPEEQWHACPLLYGIDEPDLLADDAVMGIDCREREAYGVGQPGTVN